MKCYFKKYITLSREQKNIQKLIKISKLKFVKVIQFLSDQRSPLYSLLLRSSLPALSFTYR